MASDEFVVTQTESIGAAVQSKLTAAEDNPLAESSVGESFVSALQKKEQELSPEDIKLLKGELRLTDDEIKRHIQLFMTFDVDGSGYLTVSRKCFSWDRVYK